MRKRILELYEGGKSTREIAQFSGFCVAAVRRVRQQFRQRGSLDPQTDRCGRKTLLTQERKQRLRELLSAQPDATLDELGARMDRFFRTSTINLWLRRRGRALGGQRRRARVPHGHDQTSTRISGVRLGGPCAPWLLGGPMNGEMFLTWVRQGLVPTLRPCDVVILDNLATHKIRGVRDALQAVGARLLYLPPYSPDFNPIEPMWSKIKQVLRSHAPRTEDQLLRAAQAAFNSISTADCKGFFFSPQYAI